MDFLSSLTALPDCFVLSNGIRVFFRKMPSSGLASVQVWVKSGSIHEGEFLGSGVSHYLEHMVFKGTEKFPRDEVSRRVDSLGGNMNAYTTFSRTVYHIDLPAESSEAAFEILAQTVLFPRLEEADARSEKDVILREIDMGEDDPDSKLSDATLAAVYRVHPLRFPIIGKRAIFNRLGISDLKTYFKKRYTTDTINIVVAGDLDESLVLAFSEKYFGEAPARASQDVFVPSEPPQVAPREVTLSGDVKILRGNMVWRIPEITHPDIPALSVLAALLGKGDSSVFWNELHEKRGLVHDISATIWNPGNEGMLWVSYAADLDKRRAVEDAIRGELSRISREGIAPELLKKTSRQALVGLVNSRRTVASCAASLGREAVEVGELGVTGVFLDRIRSLMPEAVCAVAEKYLRETACTSAAYEKKNASRPGGSVGNAPANARSASAEFETVELANGVRILLQPVSGFPKLCLRAGMRAGGLFETERTKGASALLATMLTLDAGERTAAQVAEAVESVGGSFDEGANADSISLSLETLSEDGALACEILRDALLRPHFSEENFVREKETQLAAVRSDYDDIESFARLALREEFFGENCHLGTSVFGTEASLKTQTLDDVRELYEKIVCPENLVIAASGEFCRDSLLARLESAFGDFAGRAPFVLPEVNFPVESESAREKHLAYEGEQAIVQLAFPGIGMRDERHFAAALTVSLLNGMSSRLFREVREERGLAYFVGAGRRESPEFGMFLLYAGTEKSKTEVVFEEMRKEIARLKSGDISEEALRGAKLRLSVSRRSARQRASFRAENAVREVLYGIESLRENELEKRINEVSREAIAGFAREVFVHERSLALTVS